MSHIDSFKHQLVGYFGAIPVYRALQDIDGDFSCEKGGLILGGGSGEHPALVLKDPRAAVAIFIDHEIDGLNLDPPTRNQWKDSYQNYLRENPSEVLEYFEWEEETHENFRGMCTAGTLPNSFYEADMSFDDWLVLGLGEFVFFAMPEQAPELIELLDQPYQHFQHVRFNNILLQPPNMPVYANGGNAFLATPQWPV